MNQTISSAIGLLALGAIACTSPAARKTQASPPPKRTELVQVTHDSGLRVRVPRTWRRHIRPWHVGVSIDNASIVVHRFVSSVSPVEALARFGGAQRSIRGWTCRQRRDDRSGTDLYTAMCIGRSEGVVLVALAAAEPKLYKAVGGLDLLVTIAASARGLQDAPPPPLHR